MAQSIVKRKAGNKTRKPARRKYLYQVVIERDGDGYFVSCPALQGCYTEGDTFEEALANIQEAISLHIEARLDRDETVPGFDGISVTTVEVEV